MALKNFSIRLDEEEYEKLRKFLSEYGDPDLNIGYVVRNYISDLNSALPHLKKSMFGIRNNLAFWSSMFRQLMRTARVENIMKGTPIIERIIKESEAEEARAKKREK